MTPESERPFSLGAFGMLSWDQLLHVKSFPEPGGYRVVREAIEQSGGTTGNTAVTLARIGVQVALASRVGDDPAGRQLIDELRSEGCDVDNVLVLADTPTDRGVIVVSGRGGASDRTIFWVQGARLKHGHFLPIEAFFALDLVLVDVDDPRLRLLLLDLPMHVSPRTRLFGTLTFLMELQSTHALELALRHDYLAGNVAEFKHITGRPALPDAIERFQQEMILSQVRFAAISDGSNGCLIITRERAVRIPAFEIDVVDPTGAGDAFAAGVAYGILSRWDPGQTGRFANALGALAIRELGARSSLPDLTEVEQFLSTAPLRPVHEYDSSGN